MIDKNELTNSNPETRDERELFHVIGACKRGYNGEFVIVYEICASFKKLYNAIKWIEKYKDDDYFILTQTAWCMSKNLNYLKGKHKEYWKC